MGGSFLLPGDTSTPTVWARGNVVIRATVIPLSSTMAVGTAAIQISLPQYRCQRGQPLQVG
jgi:hypothetical protein